MKRLLLWLCLFLPVLFWGALHLYPQIWWVENVISAPSLFFVYYLVISITAFAFRQWLLVVTGSLVCVVFLLMTPKKQHHLIAHCSNTKTIAQFNVYYDNENVNGLINDLMEESVDLVVLQEVSPEVGKKILSLSDIYPYSIGGQANIGLPSSQLILSRSPFTDVQILEMPDGLKVIKGVWHPAPQSKITLIAAHPPSPRNEQLWHRRNAMIHTLEMVTKQEMSLDHLVVGDFNLSSASLRYSSLFPGAKSAPVASWPSRIFNFPLPSFAMISIDHLWLKSFSGRRICSRDASHQPTGSDHKLVTTVIGY
ncbi:endonuclease/exonuclease/phosphatase family protein [Vibrio sonorensis]|uniref:endonuclease/exonuclease/phosphatase family protein n=1 Tax=Vibrio sonorensis TaxID=1004316 RepID=UPI0008DA4316|nr:endonuclease/exonuclease/phosphatase family protein [Vibrio sonorensis]